MKISFKDIFNKFKEQRAQSSGGPHRAWKVILLFFVLGLITVSFASFYIHQIFINSQPQSGDEFISKTFNEELMKEVIIRFDEKEAKFNEASALPPSVSDPSI